MVEDAALGVACDRITLAIVQRCRREIAMVCNTFRVCPHQLLGICYRLVRLLLKKLVLTHAAVVRGFDTLDGRRCVIGSAHEPDTLPAPRILRRHWRVGVHWLDQAELMAVDTRIVGDIG